MNYATQSNSNIKFDSLNSEEHIITSVTNSWERKSRLNIGINCAGSQLGCMTSVARATPTSSDQISEYGENKDRNHNGDNDEEVIVDNTDDEDCHKKSRNCDKKEEKNR